MIERWRPWVARRLAQRTSTLELEQLTETEGRRRARRAIEQVARTEAERLGLRFAGIQIRDQRTRWGSCSSRGTLSFNWRLALAPAEVLDYVVMHELCHLREGNHSPRFWALLAAARPDYESPRAWLRKYGHELLAYRPK
ncbi:MAG: M48 metallopeptidase family protein [Gaiellaceae bacterium]